ncbi:MAG TPA: uroporphyrinogen-III synthase [Candidatus Bathyarchaeota archaeon]|nr:uroporphyrinogen-III synthase [Candidatus Bathyarchaeota archaeon]
MVQNGFTLKGRTVAITRSRDQAEETGKLIKQYEGEPYFIPAIEIKATSDLLTVENFIAELWKERIDYVLFMSVNGVRCLFSSAENLGLKSQLEQSLEETVTLAVGPKTAQELRSHNVQVGLVPAKYSSEGIIECLRQYGISGKTIYIPRTRGATTDLAKSLRAIGGKVKEIYVYESLLPDNKDLAERFLRDLIDGKIDAMIYGSSLSAKNLFKMLRELISKKKLLTIMNSKLTIVAIGPVTAEALSEIGLRVDVIPDRYTFKGALIELACYWSAK